VSRFTLGFDGTITLLTTSAQSKRSLGSRSGRSAKESVASGACASTPRAANQTATAASVKRQAEPIAPMMLAISSMRRGLPYCFPTKPWQARRPDRRDRKSGNRLLGFRGDVKTKCGFDHHRTAKLGYPLDLRRTSSEQDRHAAAQNVRNTVLSMEMHQIRYFLAVAEELNFTRAARRCNVAQPSLTRAIRLLEQELGGALFNRERSNTHMSELGRVMQPHLEQVWTMTQATRGLARDVLGLKKTKLRLGVMCTITPDAMVGVLKSMRLNHPLVKLEILDDTAESLSERLLRGEIDIAIICMEGKDDLKLHALPIFKEEMRIVVANDHPLACKDRILIGDLDGERYLERMNCEIAARIGAMFEELGFDDETVCRSERDDWIVEMAAAGFGYACMPASSVRHPGVVARPFGDPEIWRKIHLVTVRGRPHSPAVGALVREVMGARWLGKTPLARKRAAELPAFAMEQEG